MEDVVEETAVETKEAEEVHSYWGTEPETHKTPIEAAFEETAEEVEEEDEPVAKVTAISEHPDHDSDAPVMGTMAEEEIEEEEADLAHYVEELEEDEFVEMEEETTAASDFHHDDHAHEIAAVGEPATETIVPFSADPVSEEVVAVGETEEVEDEAAEEDELEEAQAEAEALLDAEARGNGTVDARVEVRAPESTAAYTQRARRPGYDRRGATWTSWWRPTPLPPPRQSASPADQRSFERRPGNPGADRERTDRQKRRAHHQPHRVAGTLPGLHADGEPYWCFAQDRLGRRTPAPEAHHYQRT